MVLVTRSTTVLIIHGVCYPWYFSPSVLVLHSTVSYTWYWLWKQERCKTEVFCVFCLCSFREPLSPGNVWQGCSFWEITRWSCDGEAWVVVEIPQCWRCLYHRYIHGVGAAWVICPFQAAKIERLSNLRALRLKHQVLDKNYRIWCLPWRILVLFWFNLHSVHISPFCNSHVYFIWHCML